MDFLKYPITQDDADRRIDRIIRRFLPDYSLSRIYPLFRKGLIRLNGKKTDPAERTVVGSELWIARVVVEGADTVPCTDSGEGPQKPAISKGAFIPEVLFENADILFLNKPFGISVHGEDGLDRLVSQSANAQSSLSFRTGPLHRLDKDTTGILAFSRSLHGARWFSAAMESRAFEKYYLGIAEGHLEREVAWKETDADGKEMSTVATPLAYSGPQATDYSLIRFRIMTGRKHQIRIQASEHGHPLSGDARYGSKRAEDGSYFLHARELALGTERPEGIPERLFAPLPDRFSRKVLEIFGPETLAELERGVVYWKNDDEHQ